MALVFVTIFAIYLIIQGHNILRAERAKQRRYERLRSYSIEGERYRLG